MTILSELLSAELLTTAQVAEILTLKPQTLAKWRMDGSGPSYIRLGTAVRYKATDIQAYIEQRPVSGEAVKI